MKRVTAGRSAANAAAIAARLVEAPQRGERDAALQQGERIARRARQDPVELGKRLLVAAQREQRFGQVAARADGLRVQSDVAPVAALRLGQPAEAGEQQAAVVQRVLVPGSSL